MISDVSTESGGHKETVKKSKCKSRIKYSTTRGSFRQTSARAGRQEVCPSWDRGAWRAAVHGVAKSWTGLSDWTTREECDTHRLFSSKLLENQVKPTDQHQERQRWKDWPQAFNTSNEEAKNGTHVRIKVTEETADIASPHGVGTSVETASLSGRRLRATGSPEEASCSHVQARVNRLEACTPCFVLLEEERG